MVCENKKYIVVAEKIIFFLKKRKKNYFLNILIKMSMNICITCERTKLDLHLVNVSTLKAFVVGHFPF
jgi:hypothetical protein